MGRDSAGAGAGINMIFQYHAETDSCMNISNLKKGGIMERIEYLTEILPDGHLYMPDDIRHQLNHRRNYKIRVSVEISDKKEQNVQNYSFRRVRKLLHSLKGNLSEDIISDREERI